MIRISELRFRYPEGEFALHVPELAIAQGERVAIIGPSGCGKTTLLHLIAGIRTPQAGRVSTNDVDLTDLDDSQRRDFRIRNIGLVFQEFELLEYLDVLDNILLPYRINSSLSLTKEVRERARELAGQMGIADKLDRYANLLSQGERQRVAVCRALLAEPDLLLADEPTGNLDPTNKDRVLELFLESAAASGATLVTVTHDHDLLPRFERIIDFKEFYDMPTGDRPARRPAASSPQAHKPSSPQAHS
jgi:putative ABC transport system ATP-binding protein